MDFRTASKSGWESNTAGASLEQVNAGSLQRIADATEKMSANYSTLISERDRYKRWYEDERATTERLNRRITALRGVITRLQKKSGAAKALSEK